ncbi:MAG: flagellin, partial [Pseudomonadota bacterium]
ANDELIKMPRSTINDINVNSVSAANDTISRVDAALTKVSSLRSDLGAIQNRFESTITNLETVSENLSASRGRILDADFASETAALTKAQILQQAGVAILSQANAQPQLVLSLLQ